MAEPNTPDYVGPPGPNQDSSRRSGWIATLVAVPVVLVLLVLVVSRLDNEDPLPAQVVIPEAPTDGMASRLLDVRVAPHSDLVDGQEVTVMGSGFPAGQPFVLVMCTNAARVQGVNACDINTSTGMTGMGNTATDGTFTFPYTVHRFINVGGQPIDCMTGNVNPDDYAHVVEAEGTAGKVRPDGFTCIIATALLNDYDQSGGWPISFAGAEFVTPVPTVIIPPSTTGQTPPTEMPGTSTSLMDGTTITVTVPPTMAPPSTGPPSTRSTSTTVP